MKEDEKSKKNTRTKFSILQELYAVTHKATVKATARKALLIQYHIFSPVFLVVSRNSAFLFFPIDVGLSNLFFPVCTKRQKASYGYVSVKSFGLLSILCLFLFPLPLFQTSAEKRENHIVLLCRQWQPIRTLHIPKWKSRIKR